MLPTAPQPAKPTSLGIVDPMQAQQLNDGTNNQLIVNLYQCIQGLQAQVAQLQSQVHLQNQQAILSQHVEPPRSLYGMHGGRRASPRRNRGGMNANSFNNLPQTQQVKQNGRKVLDLPELKPMRNGSRGNLMPSQGGSLTPLASMPNPLPPFNQYGGVSKNNAISPNLPNQYQTPKTKYKPKKQRNIQSSSGVILGGHSYLNSRKPDSQDAYANANSGYVSAPNTGKKAARHNMININTGNWPPQGNVTDTLEGNPNQFTPVNNAKTRMKQNYSEINIGQGGNLP